MDNAFFISRDARMVANELQNGDSAGAAALLREDCAHMNPGEFSCLLREIKRNECNAPLADIELYRDGNVMVRSQDGRHIPAGQLPQQEVARLLPPPPPPEYCPPPVVYVEPGRPVYMQPERCYPQPHPLNNTIVDTLGGALIGGIIGSKGHGRNGALDGALIGGAVGAIGGTALDNARR